jgi:hypothetical protein
MSIRRLLLMLATIEKIDMRTGLWLGELNSFWNVVEQAGLSMDISSLAGGDPFDPKRLAHEVLSEMGIELKNVRDRRFMDLLERIPKKVIVLM